MTLSALEPPTTRVRSVAEDAMLKFAAGMISAMVVVLLAVPESSRPSP
jgi:hypothetical protein